MSMSLPNMESLPFAADVWKFCQPEPGETEAV
jgi:hypothetical protein